MVIFSYFLSKIKVFLYKIWPKMTIVHNLKTVDFNRTPGFCKCGYGSLMQLWKHSAKTSTLSLKNILDLYHLSHLSSIHDIWCLLISQLELSSGNNRHSKWKKFQLATLEIKYQVLMLWFFHFLIQAKKPRWHAKGRLQKFPGLGEELLDFQEHPGTIIESM